MEGTHFASLPLEVACNYLRRLDAKTLVALTKDPNVKEQIDFCVTSLRVPSDQTLDVRDLVQLPSVTRVEGTILIPSVDYLGPCSRQIRGDLNIILDEIWYTPKSPGVPARQVLSSRELLPRISAILQWLYVRKTLYPFSITALQVTGQPYDFIWEPGPKKLTLVFPVGQETPDICQGQPDFFQLLARAACLPLSFQLEPLLVPLTPDVQRYEFVPYSIPEEREHYSANIINNNYQKFTAQLRQQGAKVDLILT